MDGVNLTVARGEVFGFLGPKGAGETTAISMMLGLVRPGSGRVQVFGKEVSPGQRACFAFPGANEP